MGIYKRPNPRTARLRSVGNNEWGNYTITQLFIDEDTDIVTSFALELDTDGDGIKDSVVLLHIAPYERDLSIVEQALNAADLLGFARKAVQAVTDVAVEVAKLFKDFKKVRIAAVAVTALGGVATLTTSLILNHFQDQIVDNLINWVQGNEKLCYRSQSGEDVFWGPLLLADT